VADPTVVPDEQVQIRDDGHRGKDGSSCEIAPRHETPTRRDSAECMSDR